MVGKMHLEDTLDFPQRNKGCLQLQKAIECCFLTRLLEVSIIICHSLYRVAGTFTVMRKNQAVPLSYININSYHTELDDCSKFVDSCLSLSPCVMLDSATNLQTSKSLKCMPQFP